MELPGAMTFFREVRLRVERAGEMSARKEC